MNIGASLKRGRELKKLSQQEVADLLNIFQKTLSNIESDKSKPAIDLLSKMCEYYDLDL